MAIKSTTSPIGLNDADDAHRMRRMTQNPQRCTAFLTQPLPGFITAVRVQLRYRRCSSAFSATLRFKSHALPFIPPLFSPLLSPI